MSDPNDPAPEPDDEAVDDSDDEESDEETSDDDDESSDDDDTEESDEPAADAEASAADDGEAAGDPSDEDALGAAAEDADANAGDGTLGEPVSGCHGHSAPEAPPADPPAPEPTSEPTGQLWVRVAMDPANAPTESGSIRLQGGTYDVTLAIATSFVANEESVDVVFEEVPTSGNYSVTYLGSGGQQSVLVRNAAYASLQDDSLPEPPPPAGNVS